MGRKSRRKKLHRSIDIQPEPVRQASNGFARHSTVPGFALFLFNVIRWGAYLALFAPLVVYPSFFFPFVVPKTVFFWMAAEVIFAAWILLALSNKQFRPRWNFLTIALALFIFITILTSFTGINVERSFWSTFERMAGTINWIHLALFFLVLSSTFRTFREWRNLLTASLIAAMLVSVIFLFQKMGVSFIPFDTKSGSTIGNSSFMAAYLLFNVFFGIWLFIRAKETGRKIFYGIALGSIILSVLFATAYGALLSMLGGFFIILLAWLFLKQRIKYARPLAAFLLVSSILLVGIIAWGTLTQNKTVLGKLPYFFSTEGAMGARQVVWDMGLQGVKERPLLGWGPENFNAVFSKYFNPCLPLNRCGGEVWFDRTHNILLDSLINSGIIGLLSYLAIFASALFLIWRKFLRDKDWLLPSIVIAALASYFVQNLLVFDMLNTYLMFALTLAFVGGINAVSKEGYAEKLNNPKPLLAVVVSLLLIYYFFSFGVQSLQAANLGIRISGGNMEFSKIIDLYKKGLSMTPLGNRQGVEFFTNRVSGALAQGTQLPGEFVAEVGAVMEKTARENPEDFRHRLFLANFYYAARNYYDDYINKSEEVLLSAIELSPNNQQIYTGLGFVYAVNEQYEKAIEYHKKAVDLEPSYAKLNWILGESYKAAGEEEKAEESFERARELGYKPKK